MTAPPDTDMLTINQIADLGIQLKPVTVTRWAARTNGAPGTYRGGVPGGDRAKNVDCISSLRYAHARGWCTYVGATQPPINLPDGATREYHVITTSGIRKTLYLHEVVMFVTMLADVIGGEDALDDLEAFWADPVHPLKRVLPWEADHVHEVPSTPRCPAVRQRMWHRDRVEEALRHWGHLAVTDSTDPGPSFIRDMA